MKENLIELFNERAGIREFDGGLSRDIAERLAEEDVEEYRHQCEVASVVRMYREKGGEAVMATIEERRKTDRERVKRWRKKKLAEGNKQIQIMLTPEAQAVLQQEKAKTGEPFVQIINRAIIGIAQRVPEAPAEQNAARPLTSEIKWASKTMLKS